MILSQGIQAVVVAAVVGVLLYLRLDSGMVTAEPAPRLLSIPLCIVAAIFAASAWSASIKGWPQRVGLLLGMAVGAGGYAILRLFVFA
jgi:hypothetical protein